MMLFSMCQLQATESEQQQKEMLFDLLHFARTVEFTNTHKDHQRSITSLSYEGALAAVPNEAVKCLISSRAQMENPPPGRTDEIFLDIASE